MTALILGGAASGKSEYGERLALSLPRRGELLYLATMEPAGGEAEARIRRHRALRAGKGFQTWERSRNLAGCPLPEGGTVLLEDLGNLAANELFGEGSAGKAAVSAILDGVDALCAQARDVVIVSNELFSDGEAYAPETLCYLDVLGEINRTVAQRAHRVIEVVCGIPVIHKNEGERAG